VTVTASGAGPCVGAAAPDFTLPLAARRSGAQCQARRRRAAASDRVAV